MLYETEKTVLALVITYPDLREIFDQRYKSGMFTHPEANNVFGIISELLREEKAVDWDRIIERSIGRVDPSYITGIQDKQLLVIAPSQRESYFISKMNELDDELTRKLLSDMLSKTLHLGEPEIERIKKLLNDREESKPTELSDITTAVSEYTEWKEREHTGISFGFPTIDNAIGDFSPGELVAIMGRTATGKTFTALNTLHSMRSKFTDVNMGIFSMEMGKATLSERMMQINSGVSRLEITPDHQTALIQAYRGLHVYSRVYSTSEIADTITKDRLRVAVIDHLQLIKGQGTSLYEKTTRIMQDLKTMAKERGCVLFILVQLSRKAGDGDIAVRLDHARDSGAIEEHSDFIVGIWNPGVRKDTRTLKLLKNKRGWTLGIDVHFDENTGRMIEQVPETR